MAVSQMTPPPPAPVPPNASRVAGTVRKFAVWPPGSLRNARPPVLTGETFYSIVLEIHTSEAEKTSLESLARPGTTIEAFTPEMLEPSLVGKQIEATVTLTGDTNGVRWQISGVHALP